MSSGLCVAPVSAGACPSEQDVEIKASESASFSTCVLNGEESVSTRPVATGKTLDLKLEADCAFFSSCVSVLLTSQNPRVNWSRESRLYL